MKLKRGYGFTLRYATELYDLAVKMYKKQNRKGFNISIIRNNGEYRVVHMRQRSPRAYLLMDYNEIEALVYANLDRRVTKREAVNLLHKEVNKRIDFWSHKFK